MHIRLRKNKSGSSSVFIVESVRIPGKNFPQAKMVKSFGSSADPLRIAALQQQAEEFLQQLHKRSPKALHLNLDQDLSHCTVESTAIADIYSKIFAQYLPKPLLNPLQWSRLRDVAILRIIQPASKLRTSRIAEQFGCSLSATHIYKLMDQLDATVINHLKDAIYASTQQLLKVYNQPMHVMFYDLTSIAFETNTQDTLRQFGFSKDGKHQHVQIMLALLVTQHGLPIGYEIFPGNSYEGHTLIPVLQAFKQRYSLQQLIVVADSGLMSQANTAALRKADIHYIIAARIKSSVARIKQAVFAAGDYQQLNADMRTKSIALGQEQEDERTLLIFHSAERARKDAYDRALAIERIRKVAGGGVKRKLVGALRKSYVCVSKDSYVTLDEAKLEEAAKWDGYFGLETNLRQPDPERILGYYRGLWQVEQTFRITKHNLSIRPIFHYTERRIEAHFAICYLALFLVRSLEFLLKQHQCYYPPEQLHEMLAKVQRVKVTSNGETFYLSTDYPKEVRQIYALTQTPLPKKFSHHPKM